MKNITASINPYNFTAKENLKMCAPIVVYLTENYPKQYIKHEATAPLTDYNKLSFVQKTYGPMGDNIYFQIFPLGSVDDTSKDNFNLLKKYSSQKDNYIHYPSMTISPSGTLISAPVLFDALDPFIQNGLIGSKGTDLEKTQAVIFGDGDPSSSSFINWQPVLGVFNKIDDTTNITNTDGTQVATFFTAKEKDKEGYMSTSKGNFGVKKKETPKKKDKTYSYVQGIPNPVFGKQYDPKKHTMQYTSKRIYKLINYASQNPLKDALSIVQKGNSYTFLPTKGNGSPFLFIINFSDSQNASANIDFGYNRITISPQWKFLSVSGSAWYDANNGRINLASEKRKDKVRTVSCSNFFIKGNTKLPFFFNTKGGLNGANAYSFITYPAYCGIAIQPGLQFPDGFQSSKQCSVIRPSGSVAQLFIKNKKRVPTFQTWMQLQKAKYKISETQDTNNSDAKNNDCNIFLQPYPANWSSTDLKLTLDNCTANFFYMPLYFVSKCRFRMYFKGIKSGKYSSKGIPQSGVYVTSANISTTACTQSTAVQYKSSSTAGSDTQGYDKFAEHTYYGSLIYTTQYGEFKNDGSNQQSDPQKFSKVKKPSASYITTPVTSYRIPPIENGKQFWDQYSKDGYYFDFKIDLAKNNDGSANSDAQPYVRAPIQVQGVMVMQVTEYVKALLDNKNGSFKVKQSALYDVTSSDKGQLPITSAGGISSVTPVSTGDQWIQYIQNISVSWNQEGGSGSITLDKYALMGQQALPQQCIGGLQIVMNGGNPNIINCSSSSAQSRSSCIFTGYGTKMSMSDSISQDTITITLQGPQRKLTDLKLINPPFWDGDPLQVAYQWLSHYSGIQIVYDDQYFDKNTSYETAADNAKKYVDQNGDQQERDQSSFPMFPTSSNFKRPAVYIKTGQDCFSVFKKLAQMCNCRFVLQPDGKAYPMTQTKLAVPQMCDWKAGTGGSGSAAGYKAVFNEDLILSYSVQPLLNNLHNFVITAAFYAAKIGDKQGQSTGSTQAGFKVNKKFRKLTTTPQIPWAKAKAFKHEGFMSQAKTREQFERDICMVSSYWLSVKVTIPGNQTIWIYDILTMFGIDYYVTDISHNIDLVGKKWTTQLTLSNVFK